MGRFQAGVTACLGTDIGAASPLGSDDAFPVKGKDVILRAQLARALDLQHPHGFQAAKDLLDRVAPPESKTVLAGDASVRTTRVERVIIELQQH